MTNLIHAPFTPRSRLLNILKCHPVDNMALGACLVILGLIVSIPSALARAEQQEGICPMFLMDFECSQYRQRLGRAGNDQQRTRITVEYLRISAQRGQDCRCNDIHDKSGRQIARTRPRPRDD